MPEVMIPYKGISFPFRISSTGRIATSTTGTYEIGHILESVQQIVSTSVGERFILRNFGGGIPPLVFEPMQDAMIQVIRALIFRAISRWEKRVIVRRVDITSFDTEEGVVVVEMDIVVIKFRKLVTVEVTLR